MQASQITQCFLQYCTYSKTNIVASLKKALTIVSVVFCGTLLSLNIVVAAPLEKEKLAAVLTVINYLLLDEVNDVTIKLNDNALPSYTVTDKGFTVAFDLQNTDLELCFILSSSNLQLSINGVEQTADNQASSGENCYVVSQAQQTSLNQVVFQTNTGTIIQLSSITLQTTNQTTLGLPSLTRSSWGNKAVRKVLRIFAFGGHATDSQIQIWADMQPRIAIAEMLNFQEHNLKLSPLAVGERYRQTATQYGKLADFATFLADPNSDIPIPQDRRDQYAIDRYNFDDSFVRLVTTRGLNPFRQRIGFWETNYHLAVNLDTEVTREQVAAYYDEIMEAHEAGLPYHQVIGVAAKSAAVAMQYGHRRNEWVFDRREDKFVLNGNYDFAREIHQLFYGIFGINDPNHENETIIETGKMLTDMRVDYVTDQGYPTSVTFETERHHTSALQILGQTISGANASQKIDNLMPVSINHPESLANLPSMIIGTLADDNLTPNKVAQLNASWASMGSNNKNLLTFIQAYAISDLFHGPEHRKYFTSHERSLYLANKFNLDNLESFFGGSYYGGRAGRQVDDIIEDDSAGEIFIPLHNVFGGQTSQEAADSALSFEKNYNFHTQREYETRDAAQCDDCDQGDAWWKKWPSVLPQRSDGQYYVEDVAPWLWRHVTGSMDNYSELERAHLYTLLGAYRTDVRDNGELRNGHQDRTFDLSLLMCIITDYQRREGVGADISLINITGNSDVWYNSCTPEDDGGVYTAEERALLSKAYTGDEITNDPIIQSLLNQIGQRTFDFDSNDRVREFALERINVGLGFIFTTPFVFAEGQ